MQVVLTQLAAQAMEQGYAFLVFDGPGQGAVSRLCKPHKQSELLLLLLLLLLSSASPCSPLQSINR